MDRLSAAPNGTVTGRVSDLDDSPVPGVVVRIGSQEAKTDANGDYTFHDIPIGNYVVSFEHPDYVFVQRPVMVEPYADPSVEGRLLHRKQAHKLNVDVGAHIEEWPLALDFEPGDLIFEDGLPVHGDVDVVVTPVDPRQKGHLSAAPARLEGITVSDHHVGLFSYGMLEVEIFQGTRRVQVRPGETVRVTLDLRDDFNNMHLGDTIPMWHHDTNSGVWVQERGLDAAVKRQNDGTLVAVAELPHFSAWNYDTDVDATCGVVPIPTNTQLSGFRIIGTDAAGNIDQSKYAWQFTSQCQVRSNLGAYCITNVPTGTYGGSVYFKFQAQMQNSPQWCDLDVPLNTSSKVVFQGSDVNTWLSNQTPPKTPGSWCGIETPTIGYGQYIDKAYTLGNFPATLPQNNVRFGVANTTASCVNALMGSNVVQGDSGFAAMRTNSLSLTYKNDFDRDGANDGSDNCSARSGVQTDSNANNIGNICEPGCYVPANDPYASWYDYDGDGVDDLCDNNQYVYNPAQYAPTN